jgi:hypothetical protein
MTAERFCYESPQAINIVSTPVTGTIGSFSFDAACAVHAGYG